MLALAACAARDQIAFVPATTGATFYDVLFATNRAANDQLFGRERSATLTFGQIRVSVPSDHKLGVVEYPDSTPAPQTEFGVVEARTTETKSGFGQLLDTEITKRAQGQRTAIVFVHGFNNTFAEALFMNTQLLHDYKGPCFTPSAVLRLPAMGAQRFLFIFKQCRAIATQKRDHFGRGKSSRVISRPNARRKCCRHQSRIFSVQIFGVIHLTQP
jgi:hypothetical protein